MRTLHTVRMTIYGAALAWMLSASLIACNNKTANTNNLSKGSLQSDGATIFSSTTLAGQPLNIAVRNFTLTGANPYAQQQYGQQYGQQPYYQQQAYQTSYYGGQYGSGLQALTFELTINSDVRSLTSQLTSNANGNGYQQGYQQQYYQQNSYGSQYGAYGQTIQMASYFQVTHQAMCYQYTCDEVLLSIIIQSYNGEARQIAIRRNMRENRIVNMSEYPVTGNQFRPIDQLMREI